ncbi:MAG: glycosyltransferase [Candidatus Xenobia bacterium]
MRTSIIIPVFNKWELTDACLVSLQKTVSLEDAEVIVVDNASSDDTPKVLPERYPWVVYQRQETNLGYSGGNNAGARIARGEFIVLLNNDTVTTDGWLEHILQTFEREPRAGIVGARLLYPNGTVQHAGVSFTRHGWPGHHFRNAPSDFVGVNRCRRFQVVTGACLTIRNRDYQRFNGLDETFRNGYEDVDLCLRAGQAGLEVWYQPASVVYHYESQSPGRRDHDRRNGEIFMSKWQGKVSLDMEDLYASEGFAADTYRLIDLLYCAADVPPADLSPVEVKHTRETSARIMAHLQTLSPQLELMPGTDPGAYVTLMLEPLRVCAYLSEDSEVVEKDDVDFVLQYGTGFTQIDAVNRARLTWPAELPAQMLFALATRMCSAFSVPGVYRRVSKLLLSLPESEHEVYCERFREAFPTYHEPYLLLSDLAWRRKQPERVRELLNRCCEINPLVSKAVLGLAELDMQRDPVSARRRVLSYLRQRPTDGKAIRFLLASLANRRRSG